MRHRPNVHISPLLWRIAGTLLALLALAGCSQNKGPATSGYLQRYVAVSAGLTAKLESLPRFSKPVRPVLLPRSSSQERRDFNLELRNYPRAMTQYYNRIIERSQVLSRLYGEAQNQMGEINAAGAEPAAVRLIILREHAIGQRREFFVEMGRFAALNRDAAIRRQGTDEFDEVFSSVFDEAIKGFATTHTLGGAALGGLFGALDGLGNVASTRQEEKVEIFDQTKRLRVTATQLQRDVVEYQTAHSEVLTTFQSKYSDQDWSFMSRGVGRATE